MKIKKIYVEAIDDKTGQVLPKVETFENEFLGRNLPITNRVAFIESRRVNSFGLPSFNSNFCFAMIPYFPDPMLKEYINHNLKILKEEQNQRRISLAGLQRVQEDRKKLTEREAFSAFEVFVETGIEYVPIEIPLNYNFMQIKSLETQAESILNKNQKLILELHSSQDHEIVGQILNDQIAKGTHFLYLGCGSLAEEENILSCAKIWDIISKQKIGQNIPLVVAKHPQRYQESYSKVSSSFAFNSFNIPLVAEYYKIIPEEKKIEFNKRSINKYNIYSISEGRFIPSGFQEILNKEFNLKKIFQQLNLMQGFGPYDALLSMNFEAQQIDTALQNDAIIHNAFTELINNKNGKVGWHFFYNECRKKINLV